MMPPLVAALLVACSERAGHLGSLELARQMLVAGQSAAAERVLSELETSAWVGHQARFGRKVALALQDRAVGATGDPRAARAGVQAFPLHSILRAAFERGEFDAVLRLAELVESLGERPDPALRTAAQIESGRLVELREMDLADLEMAREVGSAETPRGALVAARVREHLTSPRQGTLLLDRRGDTLGHVVGGELVPAEGVDETLLPRNLVDRAADFPDAGSLHLTLDRELSEVARRSFGRFRGSIVLVDPATGEILAAVSDRRTFRRENGRAAFEQGREPASIAKLITAAASLRAGHDPDEALRHKRCKGHEVYAGERLYCPVIAGPLRGLDRAMAVSCNVAFADLGVEAGREAVVHEMRAWGFDGSLGAFAGGRILQPWGDERQLADLSIGLQHAEITPLHAALMAATVAGEGRRPVPTLVAAVDGKLGLHPRALPLPAAEPVLDAAWAAELHRSMRAVVERGTAMRVRTSGFPVAMKTGTASDPRWGFHVNYIGYGPVTGDPADARVAFAVRVTDRPTSRHVRAAATEVTARLLRGLRSVARERDWMDGRPPERLDQRVAEARSAPRNQRETEPVRAGR